ncbi:hypothetical protein TL16_g02890 [Triparma laevis f. inornata]|uniref:Uncharacterized protein n=1 Tax=Triparma laevis f. inornata TaxID=1714386 RepID=A0A9W6ZSL6_9STRA|nr:hypothetical protein TL16_g02890 [Triparma laevis f. inornata]
MDNLIHTFGPDHRDEPIHGSLGLHFVLLHGGPHSLVVSWCEICLVETFFDDNDGYHSWDLPIWYCLKNENSAVATLQLLIDKVGPSRWWTIGSDGCCLLDSKYCKTEEMRDLVCKYITLQPSNGECLYEDFEGEELAKVFDKKLDAWEGDGDGFWAEEEVKDWIKYL